MRYFFGPDNREGPVSYFGFIVNTQANIYQTSPCAQFFVLCMCERDRQRSGRCRDNLGQPHTRSNSFTVCSRKRDGHTSLSSLCVCVCVRERERHSNCRRPRSLLPPALQSTSFHCAVIEGGIRLSTSASSIPSPNEPRHSPDTAQIALRSTKLSYHSPNLKPSTRKTVDRTQINR